MLSEAGIIPALAPWLKFEKPAVILPILCCYSALVMDNEVLATRVSESKLNMQRYYREVERVSTVVISSQKM